MYEITVKCPATIEAMEFCDAFVESIAQFFSIHERESLVLSIHEAIINSIEAMKQLYGEDHNNTFSLYMRITEEELMILVIDRANGIPAHEHKKLHVNSLEDLLLAESGRGLLLIKELMDDMWFEQREDGEYAIGMKMRR
ncbi:ATP-binding protein [Thermaerobacillus caldiproteolyticus]|uniref:ATP-binding protein n=1 Tax=Thermaerobacillus caldiproteolyticus TaxID=247480 RepID=UPI001F273D50|nr:ATP-binding protein [Anoxybacillus caldiproteolyticus]